MDRIIQIDTFSRFTRVSRETITSLKKYENILAKANESLNLVGKSTIKMLQITMEEQRITEKLDILNNILIEIRDNIAN